MNSSGGSTVELRIQSSLDYCGLGQRTWPADNLHHWLAAIQVCATSVEMACPRGPRVNAIRQQIHSIHAKLWWGSAVSDSMAEFRGAD